MKRLSLLLAMVACTTLAAPSKFSPKVETDRGAIAFLRRYLVSGGDIYYPDDARRQKLSGGGVFIMHLRPDGAVQSMKVKMSTGYAALDEHVTHTLGAYHFQPNTKGPLMWIVSFLYPSTVIVKASLIKEESPPARPKS